MKKTEDPKPERETYFGSKRGPRKAAPKKKLSEEMAELRAEREESDKEEESKRYVFKSKYREDVVNLVRPQKKRYEDGSSFVDPGVNAEFHRNTWSTDNPVHARMLREKIKEREEYDPLHIVETTL